MDMPVPSKAGAHIGTGVTDVLEVAYEYWGDPWKAKRSSYLSSLPAFILN